MSEVNGNSYKDDYRKMLFANDEIVLRQVQKQRKKTETKERPKKGRRKVA